MTRERGRGGVTRGRGAWTACAVVAASILWVVPAGASAQSTTISLDIKLETGGGLTGLVVDHDEHGVVVVAQETPYVFAWDDLEAASAYRARLALLGLTRGGADRLTAQDHFALGSYMLWRRRPVAARREFDEAVALDPAFAQRVEQAYAANRERGEAAPEALEGAGNGNAPGSGPPEATLAERIALALPGGTAGEGAALDPRVREQVRQVYETFGAQVRGVMGGGVGLIETEHFLIWTDCDAPTRKLLPHWCEAMYAALCAQFGLDPVGDVFLAKCPVFCWRSKARFLKFARTFDGHDGRDAVGYSRSVPESGHVHVVLYQQGPSETQRRRFACTLVHEGTHAFVHRLGGGRLIPNWVNEGLAELMTERVLGEDSYAGETSALLARQYVRYDWPLQGLLESTGTIAVQEYPLAHSVVAFLDAKGEGRLRAFVLGLREGLSTQDALGQAYEGMTSDKLEQGWREEVRTSAARAATGE